MSCLRGKCSLCGGITANSGDCTNPWKRMSVYYSWSITHLNQIYANSWWNCPVMNSCTALVHFGIRLSRLSVFIKSFQEQGEAVDKGCAWGPWKGCRPFIIRQVFSFLWLVGEPVWRVPCVQDCLYGASRSTRRNPKDFLMMTALNSSVCPPKEACCIGKGLQCFSQRQCRQMAW